MKRIICILIAVLLLTACGNRSVSTDPAGASAEQIEYDWMAGTSPISAARTGRRETQAVQICNGFECTDTGCYWMCDPGYLFYCDHGSDEVILLCGRPDCDHNNLKCNAVFFNNLDTGSNINWYNGYLYTVIGTTLVRMDPDGNNRVELFDPEEQIKSQVKGRRNFTIWNDIYYFTFVTLDENGQEIRQNYYVELDGDFSSMQETAAGYAILSDGGRCVVNNEERQYKQLWDTETNTLTDLTPSLGGAFYGLEECWYIREGIVYRDVYATGETTAMVDTGLEGDLVLLCYPDCLVISSYGLSEEEFVVLEEQFLYIYNWNMELVDTVSLGFPNAAGLPFPICGESPERFYLTDNMDMVPRYYIEKSEFGSGDVKVYPLTLPENIVQKLEVEGWLAPIEE